MAEANGNGGIQILVTPLGGASPSGASATEIRNQLQTALSGKNGVNVNVLPLINATEFTKAIQTQLGSGVKINVTPVVSGASTGSGKTQAGIMASDFKEMEISTRKVTQAKAELTLQTKKNNQALHDEAIRHQKATNASKEAKAQAEANAAAVRKETAEIQKATAAVNLQMKQEQAAAQTKRITTAETQKAATAMERERTALASMQMETAKFNQYLLTLNPKALTEYSTQIGTIRHLLGSGIASNSKKATAEIKKFKAAMLEAGYEGGNAMATLFTKMKTYSSYFLSSSVIMALFSGISKLISNVKSLDEAMTDLRIVTGGSREEAERLLDTYNELAQKMGTTTTATSEAAVEWQRQGYDEADTNTLVEDSMILSVVGMIESAEAAQYLTSSIKGYEVAVEDAIGIVDKLTAVDMEAAVSAGGLAEAMARTANSARLAGVDMDSLIGYIAAVGEVTQRDMSTVGEAFKTVFARYSNVKLGKLTDDETGESLNDFETALKAIGVELRNEQGNFREFNDVILEVGKTWDSLNSVQQSAVSSALGGTRQRENILVLFENLEKALKYTKIAANSSGTAMQKFSVYEESVEAKTARTTAAFENLSTVILDSRLVGGVMDLGTGFFNLMAKLEGIPIIVAETVGAVALLYSALKSLAGMKFGKNFLGFFSGLG